MSYAWWEGFVNNMEADGLKRNTVAKYLKCEKLVKLGYTNIVEFGGILDWKGEIVTD